MDAFLPMELNGCIVREMDEEAHARQTYMGYGFLLLAEYRFYDFMVSGKLARLVGIGILVISQSRYTKQGFKGLPVCFLPAVLLCF